MPLCTLTTNMFFNGVFSLFLLGTTVVPLVVFEFTSLNINGNYLIASILGFLLGWLMNTDSTKREFAGGLVLAVILALYVGNGIEHITKDTFLDYDGVTNITLAILNASGLPWAKIMIETFKEGTPELVKRIMTAIGDFLTRKGKQ